MRDEGAAESEFAGGVHQGREGAEGGRLAAEDTAAQRADSQTGFLGGLDRKLLQTALRTGQQGGGAEAGITLDGSAEGAASLILIEEDGQVCFCGLRQGGGVGGEDPHLGDAAPAALLGGGGSDFLHPAPSPSG